MPAKRLSVRKIKEVLRLKWERELSNREMAAACGVSRPTVSEYLRRTVEAGLSWPLPADLEEVHLEQLLFSQPPDLPTQARCIPTGNTSATNSRARMSPCSCSGRSTGKPPPTVISTAGSASTTASGGASWT
ncbi:integrase catalytic subunit [Alcanivorax marinus]|nr:integrase catalytic subunit [Alloalcanivorax marinus]